jgi:hypothetical protein
LGVSAGEPFKPNEGLGTKYLPNSDVHTGWGQSTCQTVMCTLVGDKVPAKQ